MAACLNRFNWASSDYCQDTIIYTAKRKGEKNFSEPIEAFAVFLPHSQISQRMDGMQKIRQLKLKPFELVLLDFQGIYPGPVA
jgi:hypothetical protein